MIATFSLRSVLALVCVLVAGCGSVVETDVVGTAGATEDGKVEPLDLQLLVGSSWTLRFGGGPDGDIPLVDGWPITLTFDRDTLGGTAACNDYGSGYTVDGARFKLDGLGTNDAGCEPNIQSSERAYLDALLDVDGIDLVGEELALSGPSTELIFGPNEPVAAADLTDRLWLLEALVSDGRSSPVRGQPATLFLASDGTLAGGTGCRSLAGNYILFGTEVLFTDFAADGDCANALQGQDGHIVGVLGDGFIPEVSGESLSLSSVGGEGLQYRLTTEDEVSGLPVDPVPSDAEIIDGIEWVFAGGDTPDGPIADPRTVDGGQAITLTFSEGGYTGIAVCNRYSGDAEVGNGRMVLGLPSAEDEGCGDELNAIAAAYYSALPLMTEFGLEAGGGQLVANGSDVELWFERAR